MAEWSVELFDPSHERGQFTCGRKLLDHFLHALVNQYEKRHLGRTYVLVPTGAKRVLGYYTLASGAILFDHLPPKAAKKLPRHPLPVILLARLAVDKSIQGQGLGRFLLMDAMRRSLSLAKYLGVHAVELDAIDDVAKAFYERYGFVTLRDDPHHLFMPLATFEDLFPDEDDG